MGSLVPGWDTQEAEKYEKNKSLTKEEIDAFWTSKKKDEEDDHTDKNTFHRSSSLPLTDSEDSDQETTNLQKIARLNTWWSRNNSAFLNETPVIKSDSSDQRSSSPYTPRGGSLFLAYAGCWEIVASMY